MAIIIMVFAIFCILVKVSKIAINYIFLNRPLESDKDLILIFATFGIAFLVIILLFFMM
jgi:hypothetical protein